MRLLSKSRRCTSSKTLPLQKKLDNEAFIFVLKENVSMFQYLTQAKLAILEQIFPGVSRWQLFIYFSYSCTTLLFPSLYTLFLITIDLNILPEAILKSVANLAKTVHKTVLMSMTPIIACTNLSNDPKRNVTLIVTEYQTACVCSYHSCCPPYTPH